MGTRRVCVCLNALVINVRLHQHVREVICLLWQWLMYIFSRKWRVWAFMHMKGLDWVMIRILYRRFLSEDDPNMADLYTRLYNSALEWANSSTLTFPVPKTWVLSHSQSYDSSGANNEKCGPRQKKKNSVTGKQHNIHAHYVNEEKIYILKPKKRTLSLPVQHPHMHKGTRTYTCTCC